MKRLLSYLVLGLVLVTACAGPGANRCWTAEQAREWWDGQEWPVGCCYVPGYAINQFEMWQEETFDEAALDREMGLCEELGYNCVRIFLHEDLWFADKDGFKSRIDKFLDIAGSHGVRATISFCTNGGTSDVHLGPQPDAELGIHGGGHWCQTPKDDIFFNKSRWPDFKAYIQDILKTFRHDDRIVWWCLYNEPENLKDGRDCLELMTEIFKWAWEVRPDQPLTAPIWVRPGFKGASSKLDIINFVTSNSDIISFHCYYTPDELETFIKMLSRFHRPMVCQEYMGRTLGSTFQGCLPIFKREKVAALNWGLVNNRCQFHLPWGHKPEDGEPALWFHDIFRSDLTPYSQDEIDCIKSLTADKTLAGTEKVYPLI